MSRNDYLQGAYLVKRQKPGWSPAAKRIFGFIIGLVLLSPVIIAIYWEMVLRK